MATILKNIRLEGKNSDFLSRITSDPGVIYYNKDSNSLKIFDGDTQGGFELLKSDFSNISGLDAVGNIDFGNKTIIANEFDGDLTGDVTGNLTGNVTGNVTGNLTGNVTGDLYGTADLIVDQANSATITASSTNTINQIVLRDSNGNFSAGTITANLSGNVTGNVTGNLTGNATTANRLLTARTINGVAFDGTANITVKDAAAIGSTPPVSPSEGDFWFNSETGTIYIRYDGFWVQTYNPV
jgi:hypothetical protein